MSAPAPPRIADRPDRPPGAGAEAAPCDVLAPAKQSVPVVFASPHSGQNYPAAFVAASRLDPVALRRSEDAFVDELYAAAPEHGAPLLRAHFPRAYVDPNREAYELDPAMFDETLPDFVNTASPRIEAGLGTIAKVVTNGEEIYRDKLSLDEALRRIETFYRPYHRALAQLIDQTRARFGAVLLIDCHSMPSIGGPMDIDRGLNRVDVVLGDRHGAACAPEISDGVAETCEALGLRVTRNQPYAGGFTTVHYGRPEIGVHVLQIEVNRALYMDEVLIRRNDGFADLAGRLTRLIDAIATLAPRVLLKS